MESVRAESSWLDRAKGPVLRAVGVVLGILLSQSLAPGGTEGFSSGRVGFTVKFAGEVSPYSVIGMYVLPAETVTLEVTGPVGAKYSLVAPQGRTTRVSGREWRWEAPREKGLYALTILQEHPPDSMNLNTFVMVPYEELQGEHLNGYRIGTYPSLPLRRLSIYRPPRGFIEVTEENQDTPVSPNFRLRQFLCKQNGGYPKYVVLRERLILKLETILERVNERGYACDTFHVMSGYRTPFYNEAIRDVRYSRHLWGGAADIFIDQDPEDGMMDDLNGDGIVDVGDADVLYDIVDGMYGRQFFVPFVGGLGRYERNNAHGPFVHVDVRGFRARWGR